MIKNSHLNEQRRFVSLLACITLLICACVLLQSRADAQTSNTCYVNYNFYGPPGRYKIELFEIGAPYPSRQDYSLWNSSYKGQFTYRATWSYISINRWYFIRVTNDKGVAKQNFGFEIYGHWDPYNAPSFNWYKM